MSTEEQKQRSKKNKAITLIKKSNELVEARYRFTLWEIRLFEKMVKEIRQNDTDFKQVDIFIRDFIGEYDKKPNGKLYQDIRKAEELLLNRVMHIPYVDDAGDHRLKSFPLMAMIDRPQHGADYGKEDGYISLKFNAELSPYLLQLKQRYTQYDPEIMMQIDSAYVIRTYELLKMYEYVGSKTVKFDEFREMIGAREYDGRHKKILKDTLKTWEHIKQRVLEPAYKEINEKADLTFEYEPTYERKKGVGRKRVNGIRFFNIKSAKDHGRSLEFPSVNSALADDFEKVYQAVKDFVNSGTVEKWFGEYPLDQIWKGVHYTLRSLEAGHAIQNVGGYLQAMVAVGDLDENLIPEKGSCEADTWQRSELIHTLERHRERLRAILFEKQYAISLELVQSKPSMQVRMIDKASNNLFAGYDPAISFEKNLESSLFRSFLVTYLMGEYPRAFYALTNEYQAMFDTLEVEQTALNGLKTT